MRQLELNVFPQHQELVQVGVDGEVAPDSEVLSRDKVAFAESLDQACRLLLQLLPLPSPVSHSYNGLDHQDALFSLDVHPADLSAHLETLVDALDSGRGLVPDLLESHQAVGHLELDDVELLDQFSIQLQLEIFFVEVDHE